MTKKSSFEREGRPSTLIYRPRGTFQICTPFSRVWVLPPLFRCMREETEWSWAVEFQLTDGCPCEISHLFINDVDFWGYVMYGNIASMRGLSASLSRLYYTTENYNTYSFVLFETPPPSLINKVVIPITLMVNRNISAYIFRIAWNLSNDTEGFSNKCHYK